MSVPGLGNLKARERSECRDGVVKLVICSRYAVLSTLAHHVADQFDNASLSPHETGFAVANMHGYLLNDILSMPLGAQDSCKLDADTSVDEGLLNIGDGN